MINKFSKRFLFTDPFQKSAAQLAKIQKKVDKQLRDMDKVQELQEKNVKDSTIITENLVYGQQRKHFPKRVDL